MDDSTREIVFWCLGIGVPILLTYVFWIIFRKAAQADAAVEREELAGGPTAEPPPRAFETELTAQPPPPPGALAPPSRTRELAPAGDVPADVLARSGAGSAASEASGRAHTASEIQRQAPRALDSALANTRASFFGRLKSIFSRRDSFSSGDLEDIEEVLYTSDLGPQTVQRLLAAVQARIAGSAPTGLEAMRESLRGEMLDIFAGIASDPVAVHHGSELELAGLERLNIWNSKPSVIMVVGVNGAGKTTTIGKLAQKVAKSGRRVLVAAGDTFRAAAGDQLRVWSERAAVEIFSPEGITDPSAVAFDACKTAASKGCDVVIVDTAGRLHTQKNLMEELKKMQRVIAKALPGAPHEILLVLDANSGQNALQQAREFHQALGVTGVALTKLDGTAKGGVAVGLACELKLPIKLVGVGEGIDDLRGFSPSEFVNSIV